MKTLNSAISSPKEAISGAINSQNLQTEVPPQPPSHVYPPGSQPPSHVYPPGSQPPSHVYPPGFQPPSQTYFHGYQAQNFQKPLISSFPNPYTLQPGNQQNANTHLLHAGGFPFGAGIPGV
ncbi:hypothetical protein DI09_55p180 [Mitosporidium daphniae]|uniref:Uncharacterized protein n=1 Tax=Mitosporidium daphniae TaxID=1485682 RepID=A0A098VSW6_9MICR|nr:uncharacterized protein DI09_55p180 [Mitosporidium daphniae]KGG50801.1 hypothetical protein DI09_55p180 [Mitosporidium daphniae]|eukprot:XP_013237228.1 uncharacterized protein DI09_55p180 [Mitosporidium daphniae]